MVSHDFSRVTAKANRHPKWITNIRHIEFVFMSIDLWSLCYGCALCLTPCTNAWNEWDFNENWIRYQTELSVYTKLLPTIFLFVDRVIFFTRNVNSTNRMNKFRVKQIVIAINILFLLAPFMSMERFRFSLFIMCTALIFCNFCCFLFHFCLSFEFLLNYGFGL